jgi:hypothetical protein
MNASIQAHRIETTLTQNGTLTLDDLPFQAGEVVEVIVLPHCLSFVSRDRYSLRGAPLDYEKPMEPAVAETN